MSSHPLKYQLVFSKFRHNYGRVIFRHYIMAPVGIVIILFFAYLTDLVIDLLPFTFPAQAILMIILFLLLVVLHKISPNFLFHHVHSFLFPAADFLLASMGLFFTSSFVLIPRRDPMPSKEIGLIAALFLPSFLITWVGTVLIVKGLNRVFPVSEEEDVTDEKNPVAKSNTDSRSVHSTNLTQRSNHSTPSRPRNPLDSALQDVEAGEAGEIEEHDPSARTDVGSRNSSANSLGFNNRMSKDDAASISDQDRTVITTREVDDPEKMDLDDEAKRQKPSHSFLFKIISSTRQFFKFDSSSHNPSISREERLALKLEIWFDPAVYFILLLIGLPLYFTPGGDKRSLPLFTGVVALSWLFSRRVVPTTWQKLLHPILVTSFIALFVVWGFGAMKGRTLPQVLNDYSTGATYLVIFRRGQGWNGSPPGVGDLLSSLLVGGIVALAFPMFRYRHDLYNNFFRFLVVVAPNCAVSLLFWPWLAHKMGMAGERAITFAGRFMSTPFGIQFIVATGGDGSLVVVLISITGIFAVLVRDQLFKLCRTRIKPGSDEYFTVGCTIGIVAAAIGTSSLMGTHSRAAATATVTFVLYGLALLALVAVPSIAEYVAKLAGL